MITRTIVCPIIKSREEEYLICKKPENLGVYPGQWGLCGGGIEAGENMEDALLREIAEELGSELVISEIEPWIFKDDTQIKIYKDGSKKTVYMIFLLFDCIAENKIIALNEEFEEHIWVKPQKLSKYDLNVATRLTFQQKGLL